jgi:AraC-like DNA-binding protein
MLKDLCVTEILNVYQNDTLTWGRRKPAERNRNGLVLFTEGEIEYYFPNKTIVATRGSLMLFPSNVPYCGSAHTQRVAYCVLDFKTLSENEIFAFGAPCVLKTENFEQLHNDFSDTISAWENKKSDAPLLAKSFLYAAMAKIIENNQDSTMSRVSSDILTYILEHYADPEISVLHLCEKFYISESQLRRNILKLTGMTTNEYITSLRLNRAKKELVCATKSIQQIAHECGFSSAYYFSRCFHQHENISPKEYRQGNLIL